MQDELVIELKSKLTEIARLVGQWRRSASATKFPAAAISHVNLALDELITDTMSAALSISAAMRLPISAVPVAIRCCIVDSPLRLKA